MIYTIGHTENYNKYYNQRGSFSFFSKKGREVDCQGGSVWRTYEDAKRNCPENYSVWGVLAEWRVDTEPTIDPNGGDWDDLLVDSLLIKLENK